MHVPIPNATSVPIVRQGIFAPTAPHTYSIRCREQPASVFLSISRQVLLVDIAVLPMKAATIAATTMEATEPCLLIPCSSLAFSATQHSITSFSEAFAKNAI